MALCEGGSMDKPGINKILIIGSGPIVIGQACEFDYSGTQACKALRSLGYEIVLVNSNPATIMTDPETADKTYIEPLNVDYLEQIIAKERPDALLPNLGGQSGLNLCSELAEKGVLEKYGVQIIGVSLDAIRRGEDRVEFKKTLQRLGIESARSDVAYSLQEGEQIAFSLGYPVVLRPAYTMGGTGGGLVYSPQQLREVMARGLKASPVGQVLVEESILGWEELEVEVVRDRKGQMVAVCFIENIDPLGVHTGDSFCSAPMLTISEAVQQRLQEAAFKIVAEVGVIGGTNVQFAHDPDTGRIIVIEINPRTSRSSALASKATGFPIALVSAMLATGITLDEIPCGKHGTLDKYVPSDDYVVIKFARWAFEKFKGIKDELGTQMRAVGEVMSIGKTYKEAFQKALRGLEIKRFGLGFAANYHSLSKEELLALLQKPTSERQFIMYEALRKGATTQELFALTKIKPYFIDQMRELVEEENALLAYKGGVPEGEVLLHAKRSGFSDKYLSEILGLKEMAVAKARLDAGIVPGYYPIHVSGTKDSAYYYSSYHGQGEKIEGEGQRKVMVLGSGPNRIGQGIEFDYCCVHAAKAIRKLGFQTIMVNCNPETVSTDYDISDRLYFEPLTLEDVMNIHRRENPLGVIVQFGGQTPLNIARLLKKNGANIIGTPPEVIAAAEDREQFEAVAQRLHIPMPESGMACTLQEAFEVARGIGYPVIVRPSFVLGGRGMETVYDEEGLAAYMRSATEISAERPVLIDRFLLNALECESDAICDGETAIIPAVIEHIEPAGIHSGDSACVIPSRTISQENLDLITHYSQSLAREIGVKGLLNIQYAIENGKVFMLEANPRASRTVPLVSKVCALNMVEAAIRVSMRPYVQTPPLAQLPVHRDIPYYGVKEAVLPFYMFQEVDPLLGPEMRSTGEVLGLSETFGAAFLKAEEATGSALPREGKVLLSVNDRDKPRLLDIARRLLALGFTLCATDKTCDMLDAAGIEAERVTKADAPGGHYVLHAIEQDEVGMIVNTPSGHHGSIRRLAVSKKIPYFTTIAAAMAAVSGLEEGRKGIQVNSLQELHARLN